jgi:hypothetical protein
MILTTAPFVLRPLKDERSVFQQNSASDIASLKPAGLKADTFSFTGLITFGLSLRFLGSSPQLDSEIPNRRAALPA